MSRPAHRRHVVAALLVLAAGACARGDAATPPPLAAAAHDSAWRAWQAQRTAFLTTPGRPLSYTGLTWLHQGANTIGGDSTNDVVLAGRGVPARLGVIVRDGLTVRFEPAAGVAATIDSAPAVAGRLRTDADSGRPSRVEIGSAGFRIIRRLDSLGVRAWDAERAEVKTFAGLTHFPLDASWRRAGRFEPYPAPKKIALMTEAGVREEHEIVGVTRATIGDSTYALTTFAGNGPTDLFVVFTDGTSGDDTYGFRFLHAARDTATNAVVLDFNFAYNPDCAFTPYATCPLPPPENHVRAAIRAGERRVDHEETQAGLSLGDAPAPLALRTLDGAGVTLGGTGAPVTLVNVWATWCTSCREEMADLEALHRELAPRGLRVVAVSIDEGDGRRVRRFVERERLTFAVARDSATRVQRAYGVVGVPESYVLDRSGRLRWHRTGGIHGGTREAREAALRALAGS